MNLHNDAKSNKIQQNGEKMSVYFTNIWILWFQIGLYSVMYFSRRPCPFMSDTAPLFSWRVRINPKTSNEFIQLHHGQNLKKSRE